MALDKTIKKTHIRNTLGRGKFTLKEVIETFEVSKPTARKYLVALIESGDVEQVGVVRTGERGQPAKLYRVA